jgi:hypothetical protein
VTACGGLSGIKTQALTHTGCPSGTVMIVKSMSQFEEKDELQAVLYPNPSTSNFNLSVKSKLKNNGEKIQVKVTDIQGRLLNQFSVSGIETITFGSDFKPGTYFMEISTGNQKITKRAIKY